RIHHMNKLLAIILRKVSMTLCQCLSSNLQKLRIGRIVLLSTIPEEIRMLYPCHCVSFKVKAKMNEILNINEVGVGLTISI
ncbi:hypothetical protein ACTPEU_20240, partial [Clostridioides difficile]